MANAGYARMPGQSITRKLKDGESLKESGLVLRWNAATQDVSKCADTNVPYGVALRSTKNETKAQFGVTDYDTGGIVEITRSGQVRLQVAKNNAIIAIGSHLNVSSETGEEGKVTSSERADTIDNTVKVVTELKRLERIVGIAEEAVPAGSATAPGAKTVLASLSIQGMGFGP